MPRDQLAWLDGELAKLKALNLRRIPATRAGRQSGARIQLDGRELINFGSNDYLGLAADPRLADAVRETLNEHGWGSGASPLVTGRGALHAALEAELASFEQAEAAILFPSGFAANVGAVTALVSHGDLVVSDAKNHASIIDGCRLSGAQIDVYPHRDVERVERALGQATGFRRRLIVTDSLFSMDGDFAPLGSLAELADRYGAMLLVDEAHATGVFGAAGRGLTEQLGVDERAVIRVGTLSKALGSIGGFVTGSRALVDWLFNRARPYVFSTAPPEAMAAAALAALRIVRDEPQRRKSLLTRAKRLRDGLIADGWQIGASQSQIVPVFVGAPQRAMEISSRLRERGLFVPGIRPPSVPDGESLLRVSLTFDHDDAMIDRLLAMLRESR